jgi:hypothetical protein
MTTAERLQAVEQLWEALSRSPSDVPSPSWHGDVLADRKARAERGEAVFLILAELRARLRSRGKVSTQSQAQKWRTSGWKERGVSDATRRLAIL